MLRSVTRRAVLLSLATLAVASAAIAANPKTALESLKAGGKTLVGPGVYSRQANTPDYVVQLTQDTDVCGTVTLVEGDSVQLNLEDAAAVNLQGVIATANLRTVAGCADGTRNVELICTGAVPCVAVWRVDAR